MSKNIYKALADFSSSQPARFFMPGHKGKYPEKLLNGMLDITELDFSDNLMSPEGIILKAQKKGENFYKGECFFSSCGSTVPILAALSVFKNKKILMQRNSHISVYNGVELFSLKPDFVNTENVDGLFKPVTLKDIKENLNKDTSAVILTSPDYYGRIAEVEKIYEYLKMQNVKLIVDAAHGAHFNCSNELPPFPVGDITITSLHKTLPALTSAAVAVVYDKELSQIFKNNLNKLHTTSPSYLILISAEYSLEYADSKKAVRDYDLLKAEIEKTKKESNGEFLINDDFTRIVFNAKNYAYTTEEIALYLQNQSVFCEFYDEKRIIFIATPFNSSSDFIRLSTALSKLTKKNAADSEKDILEYPEIKRCVPYNEAIVLKWEEIDLNKSANRISAANVGIYPPSVPVLVAGEKISPNHIKYLIASRAKTFGITNGKIKVLKNER